MPPRVGPLEIGGATKADPRREKTDPPGVDFSAEERSTEATVATFKTSKYQLGLPTVALLAIIAGVSSAVMAWINKPPPPAPAALTPDQSAALQQLPAIVRDLQEIKNFARWAEPQIGVLLVRTDSRAYSAPPRTP